MLTADDLAGLRRKALAARDWNFEVDGDVEEVLFAAGHLWMHDIEHALMFRPSVTLELLDRLEEAEAIIASRGEYEDGDYSTEAWRLAAREVLTTAMSRRGLRKFRWGAGGVTRD